MSYPLGPRASRPHLGWHSRGYLPHFDGGAVVQTVTFRLADSLPRSVHEAILTASKTDAARFARIEQMIDEGRGSCLLNDSQNASIVRTALEHFDGDRYRLLAWVIMPNHVHALIEQVTGHRLGGIVQSWKSYSAKQINKNDGGRGAVWAPDYYDRYIRNEVHYANAVAYIENNPVKAGLVANAADWEFSSAFVRK